MNGIPWILVGILAGIVLLGIAMVVVVRRRREGSRLDYRNFFVMGVIWIPTGLLVALLPWLLYEEDVFFMGLVFLVMGLVYMTIGLVNRDKWGRQIEVLPPRARKLTIIIFSVLVLVGLVAFALFMLL